MDPIRHSFCSARLEKILYAPQTGRYSCCSSKYNILGIAEAKENASGQLNKQNGKSGNREDGNG
ncbi:hypothetical protein [Sphingobacterium sp. SYP-B4668]|uniref:hypothetical protein n=1 Tax=Sphingobacterium sp. SYP-B4668 TaxID=2996035 RepID=UPI0022DE84D2|nr:hypothetical protein [Sphingobacterium sp. SYP-B4668]